MSRLFIENIQTYWKRVEVGDLRDRKLYNTAK